MHELGQDAIKIIRTIINNSNDLLSYVDARRIYRYVNDYYETFWGKPREEIVGRHIRDLVGEETYRQTVQPKLDACLAGATVTFKAWFSPPGRPQRFLEVTYAPAREDGEVAGAVVYGRDITEQQKTNRKLEKALSTAWSRTAEVEALLDCSRIVLEVNDFSVVARRIFDACRALVGAEAGYVVLFSDSEEWNEILVVETGGQTCRTNRGPHIGLHNLWIESSRPRTPVIENDFSRSPLASALPDGHIRLDNALFAPLTINDQVSGAIGLANKPGGFNDEDARLATAFAEFAAIALRNSRSLAALAQSQEQLSVAMEAARLGAWVWDITEGVARRDSNLAELVDDDPGKLNAGHPVELFGDIHPDDEPILLEKLKIAAEGSQAFEDEYRVLDHRGHERWMRNKGRVMASDSVGKERMAGAVSDITGRKRIEMQLKAQYRFVQTLMDAAPTPIFYQDSLGRLLGCNTAFEQFTGKNENTLRGKPVSDFVDEEFSQRWREQDVALLKEGTTDVFEIQTANAAGALRNILVTKSLFTDHEGRAAGVMAVITDITTRKKAEESVRESEETLQRILDGLRAAILIIDPRNMLVVDVNDFGVKLFGEPKEQLVGRRCDSLPWRDEHGRCVQSCPLLRGNVTNSEYRVNRPDGHITPVSKTVITSPHHGAMHLFEIMLDLTEQKRLERQLTHAQKMESIGQLAAGIAHEINTPTQYVGDNLYFLRQAFENLDAMLKALDELSEHCPRDAREQYEQLKADARLGFLNKQIPRAVEQSLEGVGRVTTIVQAMKKFSHPENEERKPTDINAAVQNTVTVARNEWKYNAEMKLELADDLPLVPCYPGDLNQAILNIVVNAAHAIGDVARETGGKGVITIRTEEKNDFVDISITDTGAGIPEKHHSQIFDPFFTTKEVGKGTGQGLAITYDVIVKKHRGDIYFTTAEGEGTTFVIRLPINTGGGS